MERDKRVWVVRQHGQIHVYGEARRACEASLPQADVSLLKRMLEDLVRYGVTMAWDGEAPAVVIDERPVL